MKRKLTAGIASVTLPIFVGDSSSTTGGGLGSLVYNTSGLVGEYRRQGESSWTSISLVAGTLGTFTSGGWVADGSLTGAYEVGIPDAAFASGARFVLIRFRGATNMLPVLIEIELDAVNYQSASSFLTGVNGIAPPTNWNLMAINSLGAVTPASGSISSGVVTTSFLYAVADALLQRDWTAVSDPASRSVLNALRALRNKWTSEDGTLTVMQEDDATPAWTSALSTAPSAEAITGSDPA